MAKELKGIEELNKAIKNEIINFTVCGEDLIQYETGIETINFELSGEFSYVGEENTITYSLEITEKNYWFKEFLEKRFNLRITDNELFLILFLHEIGHYRHSQFYAMNFLDCEEENDIESYKDNYYDDLMNFDYEQRNWINKRIRRCKTIDEEKFYNMIYFTLPEEMMATNYAVRCFKSNEEHFRDATIINIFKALNDFYKINLTDDNI